MKTAYCKNPKPDGNWCMVPIEWREVETDYGLKKRPFELDTGQIHKCPYYKPGQRQAKQEFTQVAQRVEQDIKTEELKQKMQREPTEIQNTLNEIMIKVAKIESDVQMIKEGLSNNVVTKELIEALSKIVAELSQENLRNGKGEKIK
jgi:hypothetical protein